MGIIWLLFAIVGGVTCAVTAPMRGRSVLAWAVVGTLFPLIGIILVFALPSLKINVPDDVQVAFVPPQQDPLHALEELAKLRQYGAITEAEFETKKADLLARV